MAKSVAAGDTAPRFIKVYGDLLFDLCHSMLWDWSNAQVALKKILEILNRSNAVGFQQNERAYVLNTAVKFLRTFAVDHAKRLSKPEHLSLDSLKPGPERLKALSQFFQRLQDDEKLVLILRDKFGLPLSEISTALDAPEGTLKIRRSQAIRTLSQWIWGESDPRSGDRPSGQSDGSCFEFDFNLSDILDGSHPLKARRELEQHAATCRRCKNSFDWAAALSRAIAEEPRATLPIPIRRADFSQVLPRATILGHARSWWRRLPWYLRSSSEGLVIVGVILLAVSLFPKVRLLYERSLEQGIEAYQLTTANVNPPNSAATPDQNSHVKDPESDRDQFLSADSESEDDTESENDSASAGGEDAPDTTHYQKNPYIWRFNIKTDNIEEAQAQVRETLRSEKPHGNENGINAPGGVQFDLLVSESSIQTLKAKLEKLAQPKPSELKDTPGEAFSWYKSKAKGRIPKGKTRLVIWLTQY